MAREYGNRRSSRSRGGAPHQLLVITVTFILGYLTASFFDFQTLSHWVNDQVLAHNEIKKEPSKSEPRHAAVIPPKPKFEFYTLLTNEKVPSSQSNPNTAAAAQPASSNGTTPAATAASVSAVNLKAAAVNNANATPPATAPMKQNISKAPLSVTGNKTMAKSDASSTAQGKFLVQVASFKARKDAEQMKGTLILKGFSAYIIPVSHAVKGNWFRVVVGPYSNRALAQQAQIVLAKNERLNGMVTSAG